MELLILVPVALFSALAGWLVAHRMAHVRKIVEELPKIKEDVAEAPRAVQEGAVEGRVDGLSPDAEAQAVAAHLKGSPLNMAALAVGVRVLEEVSAQEDLLGASCRVELTLGEDVWCVDLTEATAEEEQEDEDVETGYGDYFSDPRPERRYSGYALLADGEARARWAEALADAHGVELPPADLCGDATLGGKLRVAYWRSLEVDGSSWEALRLAPVMPPDEVWGHPVWLLWDRLSGQGAIRLSKIIHGGPDTFALLDILMAMRGEHLYGEARQLPSVQAREPLCDTFEPLCDGPVDTNTYPEQLWWGTGRGLYKLLLAETTDDALLLKGWIHLDQPPQILHQLPLPAMLRYVCWSAHSAHLCIVRGDEEDSESYVDLVELASGRVWPDVMRGDALLEVQVADAWPLVVGVGYDEDHKRFVHVVDASGAVLMSWHPSWEDYLHHVLWHTGGLLITTQRVIEEEEVVWRLWDPKTQALRQLAHPSEAGLGEGRSRWLDSESPYVVGIYDARGQRVAQWRPETTSELTTCFLWKWQKFQWLDRYVALAPWPLQIVDLATGQSVFIGSADWDERFQELKACSEDWVLLCDSWEGFMWGRVRL